MQDSKRKIEALPALDHASMEYPDFAKNFYEEAPDIAALTPAQVRAPTCACDSVWICVMVEIVEIACMCVLCRCVSVSVCVRMHRACMHE